MAKLSLIVPIYNEENTLRNIVDKILALLEEEFFKKNSLDLEVVLVDDCSKDNSFKIAKELEKNNSKIKVFKNEKNLGKGAALKLGFLKATGDFIGIQDADEEYSPKDYIELLKPMFFNDADVVYGSRYLPKSPKRVLNFWHTKMNNFLTWFSNLYTDLDLTDMETCYKLFKKEVIQKIAPKLKENRFGFEPEVTSYIAKENLKIYECAISYSPRSYEEGKKIKAKDGFRALYCIMHYGANKAPLPLELILYFIIGTISAISNIILFLILTRYFNNLLVNVSIAFVFSAVVNYFLCILILFRHKARWSTKGEIFAYILTLAVMGTLDYFVTKGFLFFGLNNFLSKSLSSLVGFFGNFLLRKFFVFKEKLNKKGI